MSEASSCPGEATNLCFAPMSRVSTSLARQKQDVDGRDKPGHDGNEGKGKRARSNFFNRIKLIWAVQSYLQK